MPSGAPDGSLEEGAREIPAGAVSAGVSSAAHRKRRLVGWKKELPAQTHSFREVTKGSAVEGFDERRADGGDGSKVVTSVRR